MSKTRTVESYCIKCGAHFVVENVGNGGVSCPYCKNGTHVVCKGHPFFQEA